MAFQVGKDLTEASNVDIQSILKQLISTRIQKSDEQPYRHNHHFFRIVLYYFTNEHIPLAHTSTP
ncbi:hypothetical protein HMI01_23030 [Halolactibacillus miurensis]|uniref:DUF4372 domain-containing protein n=1 Tax=Halolactibacillus miurensis TaxID=306541 RepID=A0ABQ0VZQ8_9BACI|nr:hypothetical protein HMI01_23030 [Halolactibacillus miurensis]